MTIEHLAAQNPATKGQAVPEFVGSLGNLILVDSNLNNKLANKDFPEKKSILESSQVVVDDALKNARRWGDHEIMKRAKHLAKYAYDTVWKF